MATIDLNCDMGEFPAAIADGSQEAIMPYISSVNIACGGHAGNASTMRATVDQAMRYRLGIGAHPGYPDPENFGRLPLPMPPEAIAQTVFEQIRALAAIPADIRHVKPHGALYNTAAVDSVVAQAIADGVARWSRGVVLVGLAGSVMLDVFRDAGFRIAPEIFADRRYEPDGNLRSRKFPDALITEPAQAAAQVLAMLSRAGTICVHGDTTGALAIAAEVSKTLKEKGVQLAPFG